MNRYAFPILIAGNAVLFFILTLVFGLLIHKKAGEPYRFRQYFPYELFHDSRGLYLIPRVTQAISASASFLYPIYLYSSVKESFLTQPTYIIMLTIMEGLLNVSLFALTFIPLKYERQHVSLFFLYSALLAIRNAATGTIFLSIANASTEAKILDDVFAIIAFLFALLSLLPLLNPKLKNYAQMVPTTQKDGTVKLERPKYFVLAFSEWLLYFHQILSFIWIVVGFSVMK